MKKTDCQIRLETPADYPTTESLVRRAFWNVYRPGCLEHYVLHTFRHQPDFVRELDLVMEKDGELIGQIMFVRTAIACDDGRSLPIMTAGPLSIAPPYQRQGYGKMLLDAALEKATALGAGAVCFEGNLDFYRHSGFQVASTMGIHYYAEPREAEVPYFLCRELTPGYLTGIEGVYHTPRGYFVDETEAENFDRQFPPRKKEKLPGQIF